MFVFLTSTFFKFLIFRIFHGATYQMMRKIMRNLTKIISCQSDPTVVRDKDNDIDTDRFIHSLTHWQTIHSLVAREEVA